MCKYCNCKSDGTGRTITGESICVPDGEGYFCIINIPNDDFQDEYFLASINYYEEVYDYTPIICCPKCGREL